MRVRATRLTAIASAVRRFFSPSSLFSAEEQGVWYDPSDLSTLFQDAAGTTPVTAVEQPVGLMLDKSKGLVLGPELVVNGDFSSGDTGWNVFAGWTISGGKATIFTEGPAAVLSQYPAGMNAAARYLIEFDAVVRSGAVKLEGLAGAPYILVSATKRYSCVFTGVAGIIFNRWTACDIDIDNISVRELPGNHATQTTSTSQPVLSARYNLLTKTEQVQDIAWAKNFGAGVSVLANQESGPDGQSNMALVTSSGSGGALYQVCSIAFSVAHTMRVFVKQGTAASSQVGVFNTSAGVFVTITFGWSGGVPSTTATAGSPTDIGYTDFGGGLYLVSFSFVSRASGQHWPLYLPDATAGIGNGYAGYASLVPANQADLPYQRVNTATDYEADPAKFKPYLKFDGVDDFLVTNSIDFTGTDKMTVFAGVRKLSDAAIGQLVGTRGASLVNVFEVLAPSSTLNSFYFASGGSTYPLTAEGIAAAPVTRVLTGLGDISGDRSTLRLNGAQVASNTEDQGTGNYGNYPLYIGRRGGIALPFNGHLYSLVVRGAATTDTRIAQAEKWVAKKTGVTL